MNYEMHVLCLGHYLVLNSTKNTKKSKTISIRLIPVTITENEESFGFATFILYKCINMYNFFSSSVTSDPCFAYAFQIYYF